MARPSRQEAIAGEPAILISLAEILGDYADQLTQVEADILAVRAGAIGGVPMSLDAIGDWLRSEIGYSITKQRVSFLLHRMLKRMPPNTRKRLVAAFPPIGGANVKQLESKAKARKAIVALRRGIQAWTGPVQYAKVLSAFGVDIPEHRADSAATMSETESIIAIGEDFRLVRIGRFRICSACREPKLIADMYKTKTGLPYSRCRKCNREKTRDFYRNKREKAAQC